MNPIVLHTQPKRRLQSGGYNWHCLGSNHSSHVGRVCNILMTDDFFQTDDVNVPIDKIYCGYYNGSRYIIGGKMDLGDNFLMISEDGACWEPVLVPDFEYLISIGWNGSYWLISGYNATYEGIISWSSDGTSWSSPTVVGAASSSTSKIVNNNTHWFVRTYNDGIIKVPFATADWGTITHFNPGLNEIGTIECNASHMLVGNGSIFNSEPTIRYSTDFTNWSTAVYPSQFLAVDSFCRHGTLWFATVHTGNPVAYALLKSTDGVNFSEVTVDSQNTLRAMKIFSDGSKLVIQTSITIGKYIVYTSDDAGANWVQHPFDYRPTYASVMHCMSKVDPDGIPPVT